MEINALLSNITTILTKDVLVDNNEALLKPKHFLCTHGNNTSGNPNDTGNSHQQQDDDSGDEAFRFFIKHLENQKKEKREKTDVDDEEEVCLDKYYVPITRSQGKRTFIAADVDVPSKRKRSGSNSLHTQIELNLVNKFEPVAFEGFLHLSKMTFLKLFQSVRSLLTSSIIDCPPHSIFSLSLWKLSTDEHFEAIARKFNIALPNCQKIIRHFWNLIGNNHDSYMRWPCQTKDHEANLNGFQANNKLKMFENLFGVVILKRLNIFLECEDEEVSVILQIVCSSDQKVVDCYVEMLKDYNFDTTPTGKTLKESAIRLMPSETNYLIGDTNFPLKRYLICPFDEPTTPSEHTFNRLLRPAIAFGHRVLDTMAKRFNILYALEAKDLREVSKIMKTVCSLHNLCVDIEDDYIERKRGVIKFNWATADYVSTTNSIAKVNDERGIQSRNDLMTQIVKVAV